MPKIVNARELAESFDVSHTTIWEWGKEGMPVRLQAENGLSNEYDLGACIAWYARRAVEKAGGAESSKDRLARLQGDKVEMDIAIARRDYIAVKELEPAIQQWLADHRAELDRVPEEWCDALAAVGGDSVAVHETLKDMVRRLKDSAAAYDFGESAAAAVG